MYRLAEHVVIERNDEMGCYVLIDLEQCSLYRLNSNALRLIKHITEKSSIVDYINDVVKSSGECREKVELDANEYLSHMENQGFLIKTT